MTRRRAARLVLACVVAAAHAKRSAHAEKSKQDMWRPVLAELDRSLDALEETLPPVEGDQASWLARTLHHWDGGSSVLVLVCVEIKFTVLEGRAYVSERFAGRDLMRTAKNQHFLAFLSTMHRPCPNSAYNFYQASTGRVMGLSRQHDDGSHFLPPLVMAKRDGYDMLGLLVPNPYFAEGSDALHYWARGLEQIYERVEQRPFASRIPRAFWRGMIRNHDRDRLEERCSLEVGNEARFQAATLSYAYPDAVDVKCTTIKHCDVAKAPCPGRPRDEHEIATAANHSLISAGAHTHRENYTMYKYVLNLPGSTSGSYSRNLNHLWSLDSVVLLWRDGVKEWYYPALEHGVTHLDVDKTDLVKAVRGLEADPGKASKLRKGAKRVEYAFTTPESLADYLIEVLRRAGQRFFSDVLDDACTARDFFATRVDCKKLGFLAEFDLAKVMKRGTRAKSYGPGCRLILEHLSERCAANCLMGKTSNASRCSAYNDPSFDCGSRRCADACLRRDDVTGRIECLNENHVRNNTSAKCLLPRKGVATRWCGVATPAPSPRPPPRRSKKHESTTLWHSLFG